MGLNTDSELDNLPWHSLDLESVIRELHTNTETGLQSLDISDKLSQYGHNELSGAGSIKWYTLLSYQLKDAINYILLAVTVLSFVQKDYISGSLVLAITLLNIFLSAQQVFKAEQTMKALRGMSSPSARVLRDGEELVISSRDIVPGDVLLIQEGDSIAADIRLFYVSNFEVDEALLTGESEHVSKKLDLLDKEDIPLGDRSNMAYSSTIASKGRAKGIVIATGMRSEIGKIAQTISESGNGGQTKLQRSLNYMALFLLLCALIVAVIVMAISKFELTYDIGMYAMTAGLCAVPAGLTTVVTVTFVIGGKEMIKQKAIVRKLNSLETLGSVTNICSDKTGTLTQAQMVLVQFWVFKDGYYSVTSKGIEPEGEVYRLGSSAESDGDVAEKQDPVDKAQLSEDMKKFVSCAALCNMSGIRKNQSDEWIASGNPTEVALQVFAHKFAMGKPDLEEQNYELLFEYQFDSSIKRMSVVYRLRDTEKLIMFTKGATERIISLCQNIEDDKEILQKVDILASKGLRVLTLAYKTLDLNPEDVQNSSREDLEKNLNFLGLVGIYDPPRPESRRAVQEAYGAGIMVHMLTGDHEETATAIAKEVGILKSSFSDEKIKNSVITGPRFDSMTEEDLDKLDQLPLVIARCSPDTKVKMIRALHRRHLVVAMTGDGVNDSPSLKIADVGIAMGMNGSDVAKQASDIILTDDNFATIIRAIGEGRRIYQNTLKFLLYYLISILALIILLLAVLGFKDPAGQVVYPLSPIQILFMFFAITPPAAELGVQEPSKTIMNEHPRSPKKSIFSFEIILDTFVYGVALGVFFVAAFSIVLVGKGDGVQALNCNSEYSAGCETLYRARSTVLVILILLLNMQAINNRSFRDAEWSLSGLKKTLKSKVLLWTFAIDLILLIVFIYVPQVNTVGFKQYNIDWEWGLIAASIVLYIGFSELYKYAKRKMMRPVVIPFNKEAVLSEKAFVN
ncbi:potassium/sodium eff [Basidiobolus meristosporus CBS 931.73]|uniref:Sodium/potassium exporting P-type ATPase 1 n=1 Tax=Basidiobolus meristosporus CBS 931.73 TaxID=1314790 RepID=A0A1Y1XV47_9FUNG|nr:potassium/sodium eff [Basidiobolus meristosporus CBS 931.73]|eukprot:ORX89631.1 potassium/sodium eff [Basidiobolus meristosporus CBS 931.73]